MRALYDLLKKQLAYDASRDFYAKFNPSLDRGMDLLSYRPMRSRDIKSIVGIEKQVYNFPWTEGTFEDCQKIGYLCWVCERVDQVVGYAIVSIAAGEAHIMNIGVDLTFHRQGIGRGLMDRLMETADENRCHVALLEVRPSNEAAIQMYLNMGFSEIGIRKDYYPGKNGREDAVIFSLALAAKEPEKGTEEEPEKEPTNGTEEKSEKEPIKGAEEEPEKESAKGTDNEP